MVNLYGRTWTRSALLQQVGKISQIGGAESVVLDEGAERGVRALQVRTGTGFQFTILPDRGLDIWRTEYNGASLCWHSPTGPIAPAFYEPQGLGWLRGFAGGMVTTCGLAHAGPPDRDRGLHGRASYTPATDVAVLQDWEGDEYRIEVRGKVREAAFLSENLLLSRRIRANLGEKSFVIEDEVENCGAEPATHKLIYHVNGGFPVVDEAVQLMMLSRESRRRAEGDPRERVTFHRLRNGLVALVNLQRSLGFALRFSHDTLPCFTEWRAAGVVGLEPGNVFPEAGPGVLLQPGEKRRTRLEFAVLASPEEIKRIEVGLEA